MQTQQFELYLIRHGVAAERGENYLSNDPNSSVTKAYWQIAAQLIAG